MRKHSRLVTHVRWNSEAGLATGIIINKVTSDIKFKGYTHHASREAPQYLIKSDKTDHVAIHKGTALRLVPSRAADPMLPGNVSRGEETGSRDKQ